MEETGSNRYRGDYIPVPEVDQHPPTPPKLDSMSNADGVTVHLNVSEHRFADTHLPTPKGATSFLDPTPTITRKTWFTRLLIIALSVASGSANRSCRQAMMCAVMLDTQLTSSNVVEVCNDLQTVITCMEGYMVDCTGSRAAAIQTELDYHKRRKSDKCCSIRECVTEEVSYAAAQQDKKSLCLLSPLVETCMKDALSSRACSQIDTTVMQKEADDWATNCSGPGGNSSGPGGNSSGPGGNSSDLKSSSPRVNALASLLLMLIGALGGTWLCTYGLIGCSKR